MTRFNTMAAAMVALAVVGTSAPAAAIGDPNDPNWPCVQRKVPEITLATVWTGPDLGEAVSGWRDDPAVVQLVDTLAARRTTMDEARAAVDAFAEEAGEARTARLTALFAGLFTKLNAERGDVILGIGRFARKQRLMADDLRGRTASIDKMREDPNVDQMQINQRYDELNWETRVFGDRQKSLSFVCEVPVIIEQRLFRLGNIIAEKL